MAKLEQGAAFPKFRYDTPYEPQRRIADLYAEKPLFLVFLSNFGHPVTRTYLQSYAESAPALSACRLGCVVQSKPQSIAAKLPKGSLPFELLCDPESVLYRHFEVPQEANRFRYASIKALSILHAAEKEGYTLPKDKPQQLPLTVLVGKDGQVLFCHYGKSLTDIPADCAALAKMWDEYCARAPKEAEAALSAGALQGGEKAGETGKGSRETSAAELESLLMHTEALPQPEPQFPEKKSAVLDEEGKPFTIESFFSVRK